MECTFALPRLPGSQRNLVGILASPRRPPPLGKGTSGSRPLVHSFSPQSVPIGSLWGPAPFGPRPLMIPVSRWCLRKEACTCTPVPRSTKTRTPSSPASSVLWRRWAWREQGSGRPRAGWRAAPVGVQCGGQRWDLRKKRWLSKAESSELGRSLEIGFGEFGG